MAKYVFNSGYPRILGSRGGGTFQKCGQVFAIRKRNVPVQKNSPKQSAIYSALSAQASKFRSLTLAEKTTFTTFAPDFPRIDSLGNTYLVKPIALQNSMNMNRLTVGATQMQGLSAGIPWQPYTQVGFALEADINGFGIVIAPDTIQAQTRLSIFVGQPQSIAREFSKRDCKFLGKINAGSLSSGVNWYNNYIAIFPRSLLIANGKIPVYVETIQLSPGQPLGHIQGWADITGL